MDVSTGSLRVLLEVAERGSFTAAATALGYTQSGVSRQVAAVEREVGVRLFQRGPGGVHPTTAGAVLVRQAAAALEALDRAEHQIRGGPVPPTARRVRLGHVPTAGARLVPRALARLAHSSSGVRVQTREATTPALVRAVRAGTLDMAVITSRPPHRHPDEEAVPLEVCVLGEIELAVAAPSQGPLAAAVEAASSREGRAAAAALARLPWVGSPAGVGEPVLGVWPMLPGRPAARYTALDWATKLALVAAGVAVTTVAPSLQGPLPAGVRVVPVDGVAAEVRRVSVVRVARDPSEGAAEVLSVLKEVFGSLV